MLSPATCQRGECKPSASKPLGTADQALSTVIVVISGRPDLSWLWTRDVRGYDVHEVTRQGAYDGLELETHLAVCGDSRRGGPDESTVTKHYQSSAERPGL